MSCVGENKTHVVGKYNNNDIQRYLLLNYTCLALTNILIKIQDLICDVNITIIIIKII